MTNIEQGLLTAIMVLIGVLGIVITMYMDLRKDYKSSEEERIKEKQRRIEKEERAETFLEEWHREREKVDTAHKQATELENMLKALICKFNNNEVEIEYGDIKNAERGTLYLEAAYLKCAKKVKVLFCENYFKTEKEG